MISSILFRLLPKFKKSLQNLWIRQPMKYCYFFPRLIHFTEQNIAECEIPCGKPPKEGVIVKMLIQGTEENDKLREISQKVIRQGNLPVSLQYIAKPLETKISTLIIRSSCVSSN